MQLQPPPFDCSFGRQIRQRFERTHVFRPAIGIARIIDRVGAKPDISGAGDFGLRQRECEHDGVARRHIGYGYARLHAIHRDRYCQIGQRGTTDRTKINAHDLVRFRTQRLRDACGGIQFGAMTLAIVNRQAMTVMADGTGHRQRGGGIQAAGEQHDCRRSHYSVSNSVSGSVACSVSRLLAPQQFVQLHLHAHRQAVAKDPFSEQARFEFAVHRRQQQRT